MEKYGSPGPEHKYLEPLVGKWNAVSRAWMEPGKDPLVSKGTCERKWLLGKRYLQETYKLRQDVLAHKDVTRSTTLNEHGDKHLAEHSAQRQHPDPAARIRNGVPG